MISQTNVLSYYHIGGSSVDSRKAAAAAGNFRPAVWLKVETFNANKRRRRRSSYVQPVHLQLVVSRI